MNKNKKLIILIFILIIFSTTFSYAQTSIYCAICGQEISGKYWKLDNKNICNNCYENLPHCCICSIPMKSYYTVETNKICESCFTKLSQCYLCGVRMLKWYQIKSFYTGIKHKYCYNCADTAKRCDTCRLPVEFTQKPLSDGRYLCSYCYYYAVKSPEFTGKQYNDVIGLLSRNLNLSIKKRPNLYVIDKDKFRSVHRDSSQDELGLFTGKKEIISGYAFKKSKILDTKIYILSFLSDKINLWTLAHESAHAWYFENSDENLPEMLNEGFAEWVAYKIAGQYCDRNMLNYFLTRNDVYGKGLNLFIERERKQGIKGIFELIKINYK